MKYYAREIESVLLSYLKLFPAVGLTGPRQSGKSTLLKHSLGSKYKYVTFDDPFNVDFFHTDPRGFMEKNSNRVIFDEVQKVPEIFSYIKIAIDNDRGTYGKFVLTGSSQFNLLKSITESLAGRIGLLSLLPFSFTELPEKTVASNVIYGSYPELLQRSYTGYREWYSSYLENYIERDVRTLFNIGNLRDFHKCVKLLAARTSCELNMSSVAKEVGVSVKTVQSWISVLEASYIVFLLPNYHDNLGKRLVKRPKLYFYDTGLVNYLCGISSEEVLRNGPMDGTVFENYVVADVMKQVKHNGASFELFYLRDNQGLESDLIIEDKENGELIFTEIKSNSTPKLAMVKSLNKLLQLASRIEKNILTPKGKLIYRGNENGYFYENIEFVNYRSFLMSFLSGT